MELEEHVEVVDGAGWLGSDAGCGKQVLDRSYRSWINPTGPGSILEVLDQSCIPWIDPAVAGSILQVLDRSYRSWINPTGPGSILEVLDQSCIPWINPASPGSILQLLDQSCRSWIDPTGPGSILEVLDQSCRSWINPASPEGTGSVSDPAGVRELHLPAGATSLRDTIKDKLSPVPWPVPAWRDLGARTLQVDAVLIAEGSEAPDLPQGRAWPRDPMVGSEFRRSSSSPILSPQSHPLDLGTEEPPKSPS
nr:uncharacterized protein LOC113460255 [Zonotrichia albicollis]